MAANGKTDMTAGAAEDGETGPMLQAPGTAATSALTTAPTQPSVSWDILPNTSGAKEEAEASTALNGAKAEPKGGMKGGMKAPMTSRLKRDDSEEDSFCSGSRGGTKRRAFEDYELGKNPNFDPEVEGSGWKQARRWIVETVFGRPNPNPWDENSVSRGGRGGSSSQVSRSNTTSRLLRTEANIFLARKQELKQKWIILPDNNFLLLWQQLIMLFSAYSSYITPFEFAFFNVPPDSLRIVDGILNAFFLADLVVTFFVAFMDRRSYTFVSEHWKIGLRYLTSWFIFDLLAIVPWDAIYVGSGADFYGWQQVWRWMVWVRVFRSRHVLNYFWRLQKDIRLSYFSVRIVKLLTVELYITHVAGCIFYFLALTYPPEEEGLTWIGSLTLGGFEYTNFRDLPLGVLYVTSLYWSVVTMATIGYGDIHPVNTREMIFAMIYISFDLILSAYLVGNITALVVKGSNTTKYREKMASLVKFMNRNHLPATLRDRMRQHVRLQFETEQVEDEILEEFPLSIKHKVSRALYRRVVEDCYLFLNCSPEFTNQIVARAVPEYFFPDEVVVLQRDAAEHMYIVVSGLLHEQPGQHSTLAQTPSMLRAEQDEEEGTEGLMMEPVDITNGGVFGEVALLCNIPQPFTVVASELCQVLRIDKEVLNSVITMFLIDGRQLVENLLERTNEEGSKFALLSTEIRSLIAQQEAELTMTTIYAASRGDVTHLKDLVKAGANPSKADYDGRSPLHLASAGGFDEVVKFLVLEGADVNCRDNFGTTPLLEALRAGHDSTAKLLLERGGHVNLQEAGTDLCNAVMNGDTGLLKRLLDHGVDPNSADYDLRTPLHIASAEGFYLVAKVLIEHGADVGARDRWGNTALDEARRCGSLPLVRYLEDAWAKKTGAHPRGARLSRANSNASNASKQQEEGEGGASLPSVPAVPDPVAVVAAAAAAATAAVASGQMLSGAIAPQAEPAPATPGVAPTEPAAEGSQQHVRTASAGAPVPEPRGMLTPVPMSRGPSAMGTPASSVPPSVTASPARSMASPMRGSWQHQRRRGGGGLPPMGGGPGPTGQKRVTVYPFPPWTSRQRRVGRVMWLPDSLEELLNEAKKAFKNSEFKHVLGGDGGEIDSLELVLDSDRLYLASDKDLEEEEGQQE